MNYGDYQPLYKKLLEEFPSICEAGEQFLFALPPVLAGWEEPSDGRMYDFLDGIPILRNGFYCGSIGSYEDTYYQYLQCLSTYGKPALHKLVEQAVRDYKSDTITVSYRRSDYQRPAISMSGDIHNDVKSWYQNQSPALEVKFSSDEWDSDSEPIQVSYEGGQRIPLSQALHREQYSFVIRIQGLGCYKAIRGSWLHPELLSSKYELQTGLSLNYNTFFGSRQMLCRPIQKILLTYNMTIALDYRLNANLRAAGKAPSKILFLGIPVTQYHASPYRQAFPAGSERMTSILGITQTCYDKA